MVSILVDTVMSIGPACRPAYHIRNNALRTFASPLDWQMNYSLDTVLHLFSVEFKDFFQDIKEVNIHNSNSQYRQVLDLKNNIMSIHHFSIQDTLEEGQEKFRKLMHKRYLLTFEKLRSAKSILLICNRNDNKEALIFFVESFAKLFPSKKILLINIRNNEKQEEIVKQTYYISSQLKVEEYVFEDAYRGKNPAKRWVGNSTLWGQLLSSYKLSEGDALEKLQLTINSKEVYLYGAGENCKILIPILLRRNFRVKKILVTDKKTNPDYLYGIRVESSAGNIAHNEFIIITVENSLEKKEIANIILSYGGRVIYFSASQFQFYQDGE